MEPFEHVMSSTTLYANINNEIVWHKYEHRNHIDPKIISFADGKHYLVFTTSSLNKEFILAEGTYDEVAKVYRREINISVDNGFSYNETNLTNRNITMNIPMKALPFGKGKTTFPCYYQPKINGGRCIAERTLDHKDSFTNTFYDDSVRLTSKEGHNLPVKHIMKQLEPIYSMFGSPIFDGEIYLYGEKCTSINGAARNPKNPIHAKLALVIFDIILYGVSQFVRTTILDKIQEDANVELLTIANNKEAIGKVFILETNFARDEDTARKLSQLHIDADYEGIILRNPEAVYQQGKHVGNLTKIKKQLEGMFRINNIVVKPTLIDQPLFILQNDITGDSFECNPVGSHDSLKKYLINRKDYMGKMVKVTYFERTINNLPFHANVYPEVMSDYVEEVTTNDNDCNIDDL